MQAFCSFPNIYVEETDRKYNTNNIDISDYLAIG